jgi:hypothetical protein
LGWVNTQQMLGLTVKPLLLFASAALALVATAAQASTNLVVNGDFSEGNSGFTSGYGYAAPANRALWPQSVYTVTSDPSKVNPYWVHLSGSQNMLLVNGATTAGMTVWQENLSTASGQEYDFSAAVANACCNASFPGHGAPSVLEFEVSSNNFASFQTLATITTQTTGAAGVFKTIADTFSATGPLEIRLVDANTEAVGNDFAVENISVTAVPPGRDVTTGPGSLPSGGGHEAPGFDPPPNSAMPSAVPEPGEWALMLLGFVSMGAALRGNRERRAAVVS